MVRRFSTLRPGLSVCIRHRWSLAGIGETWNPTAVVGGSSAGAGLPRRRRYVTASAGPGDPRGGADRAVCVPRAAVASGVGRPSWCYRRMSALGLGGWASVHVLGFPRSTTHPAVRILVPGRAGNDYTIFLVTRAREKPGARHPRGIVRAVSATGAVITSAGIVLAAVFCVLGCAAADRAHPTRCHRRTRHIARHLPRTHRGDSGSVHADRAADLVARAHRQAGFDEPIKALVRDLDMTAHQPGADSGDAVWSPALAWADPP